MRQAFLTILCASGLLAGLDSLAWGQVVQVSGHVSGPSGLGLGGVSLTTTNGPWSATTNAAGFYQIDVPVGWSGSIIPSRSGYAFNPSRRDYVNLRAHQYNQDYRSNVVISGYCRISEGAGVPNVTVTAGNGGESATTDWNGRYSLVLPCGWSGTVTPSLTGYTFSPPNRSYTNVTSDQTGQNYTATPSPCTISGTITSGGSGLSGVTVSANNGGGSGTTNGSGNYSLTVSYGWSGTVTPSRTGYTFSPANKPYTNVTSDQTGQNYTATAIPYTISGTITSGGSGLSGVTVSANNGGGSATTDGSGNYSLTVSYGWSGTVTPSRTGYTFSPANKPYTNVTSNQTGQNYTATPSPYTISGTVTSGGSGLSGVTVSANNGGGSGTTNGSGNYSLTVSYGWSGTVTPSRTGYTFSPANKPYTNVTSNQTGQNYTATPSPYTISGTITAGGSGLSGVTVSANNGGGSGTTNGSGNYSLTVSYGWSGTVTATSTCYTFSPASRPYTNLTSSRTGENYTATQETCTIYGTITHNGAALAGVSVSANNGGDSVSTDGSGNYCVTVPCGWSGTVTATSTCYTFSPASRPYTNLTSSRTGENYTATQETCAIYGTITHNGAALAGVSVSANNGGNSVSTDGSGNYWVTVPCDWTGAVTPSRAGYTFSPPSRSYSNLTSSQTYQHFTANQKILSISGSVLTSGGTPVEGVTVTANNGGGSGTTDSRGNCSLSVPYGWTGAVTPSLAGYTFSPSPRSYSNLTSSQTLQHFTAGSLKTALMSPKLTTRVTFIFVPEGEQLNTDTQVTDAIEITGSDGEVIGASLDMPRTASGQKWPQVRPYYKIELKPLPNHPVHHKLRRVRSNYLALCKLKAGRYIVRYRVTILEWEQPIHRTEFYPAASFTINR